MICRRSYEQRQEFFVCPELVGRFPQDPCFSMGRFHTLLHIYSQFSIRGYEENRQFAAKEITQLLALSQCLG
jgi:hypothetical protein